MGRLVMCLVLSVREAYEHVSNINHRIPYVRVSVTVYSLILTGVKSRNNFKCVFSEVCCSE